MRANRGRFGLLIVVAALVAVGLVGAGVLVKGPGPAATVAVTFSAGDGGHISPSGTTQQTIGSTVEVEVWADDATETPGLVVNGKAVQLADAGGGKRRYTLSVDGPTDVGATFATLADNARVIDAASAAAVESVAPDGTSVTFDSPAAVLDSLVDGDILGTGVGTETATPVLMKVTSIEKSGNRTIVHGKKAKLTDVVRKASVRVAARVAPTGGASPAASGGSSLSPSPSPSASASARPASPITLGPIQFGPGPVAAASDPLIDVPIDHTWTVQSEDENRSATAKLKGDVALGMPKVSLSLDIDWFTVRSFEFAVTEDAAAHMTLDTSASIKLEKEEKLLDRGLGTIWVPIGPLLVPVMPRIEVGAGASLEVTGNVSVAASVTGEVRVGARWQGSWTPIREGDFHGQGRVTDAKAGMTAQVYPMVRASAMILWLCGPYFELRPGFLELQADTSKNPWWTLSTGVNAGAGLECIFGDPLRLAGADVYRQEIANAGGAFGTGKPAPMPVVKSVPSHRAAKDGTWTEDLAKPVVSGIDPAIAAKLNANLAALVDAHRFTTPTINIPGEPTIDLERDGASYRHGRFEVTYLSPRLLSIRYTLDEYGSGAAHPNASIETRNFDLSSGSEIAAEDVFTNPSEAFEIVGRRLPALLDRERADQMLEPGTVPAEKLRTWALAPSGLELEFDQGSIAAYAAGPLSVIVPWSELAGQVDPAGPAYDLPGQAATATPVPTFPAATPSPTPEPAATPTPSPSPTPTPASSPSVPLPPASAVKTEVAWGPAPGASYVVTLKNTLRDRGLVVRCSFTPLAANGKAMAGAKLTDAFGCDSTGTYLAPLEEMTAYVHSSGEIDQVADVKVKVTIVSARAVGGYKPFGITWLDASGKPVPERDGAPDTKLARSVRLTNKNGYPIRIATGLVDGGLNGWHVTGKALTTDPVVVPAGKSVAVKLTPGMLEVTGYWEWVCPYVFYLAASQP